MKKFVIFICFAILNSCSSQEIDPDDVGWFFVTIPNCGFAVQTNYCVTKNTYDNFVKDFTNDVFCEFLTFNDLNGISQSGYVVGYGFQKTCENYKSF